jgi:4a-hydroxytetrahydrobiopterin dehydratase
MTTALRDRRCVACTGDMPRLDDAGVAALLAQVPGWRVVDGRLTRRFTFPDFVTAIRFVNRLADTAEAENHHPDFAVHYARVDVTIWTHAVDGLTENDFILAAKLDALAGDG